MKEERPYQVAYYKSDWVFARGCYLGFDPRLGKTYTEGQAILRRQREAGVKRTLIVGPKNPLLMTWEDELFDLLYFRPSGTTHTKGIGYHIQLAGGVDNAWRAAVLQDLVNGAAEDHPFVVTIHYDVLDDYFEPIHSRVVNVTQDGKFVREYQFRKKVFLDDEDGKGYEKAKIARARSNSKKIVDLLLDLNFETVIVDEAHLIAAAGAARSRALRRLGKMARYVRLLSGTPDPQREESYYAQFVVMDPSIFGTSKQQFIERYFHLHPYAPGRVEGLRDDMREEFYKKVLSVMFRVSAEDYFGPNKPNVITRELHWPNEVGEKYAQFYKDSVLASDDLTLDGTHRLTKYLRCAQMCAGFVPDEVSGEIRWLHDLKVQSILTDLAEPIAFGQRVVISYTFTEAGVKLRDAIARTYNDKLVALVNGRTKNVPELLRVFDVSSIEDSPLRVLVLQEQVGGVGISLARARHLFFHSWNMDSAVHSQMTKRIWHPELVSNISYYQMRDFGKAQSADAFARAIVQGKLDDSIMSSTFYKLIKGGIK
jgi:hypothetical protein